MQSAEGHVLQHAVEAKTDTTERLKEQQIKWHAATVLGMTSVFVEGGG